MTISMNYYILYAKKNRLGGLLRIHLSQALTSRLPNQIPDEVKQERLQQLLQCQQQISWERNQAWVGNSYLCL